MSNDGNLSLKNKRNNNISAFRRLTVTEHYTIYLSIVLKMSLHMGEIFLTRSGRTIYRGRNRLTGCRTVSR